MAQESLGNFLELEVISKSARTLGRIDEFVIDLDSGKVCWVLVRPAHGNGHERYKLTWDQLSFDETGARFILDHGNIGRVDEKNTNAL